MKHDVAYTIALVVFRSDGAPLTHEYSVVLQDELDGEQLAKVIEVKCQMAGVSLGRLLESSTQRSSGEAQK